MSTKRKKKVATSKNFFFVEKIRTGVYIYIYNVYIYFSWVPSTMSLFHFSLTISFVPQKLVPFALHLCPINHKYCSGSWKLFLMILTDTSTNISHFMGKSLSPHPVTKKSFCMGHEVCILNHFSCKIVNHLR